MNFNKTNTRGGQTYETPSVTTLEVLSEGVLCGSGDFDTPGYGYDNENDLGEI